MSKIQIIISSTRQNRQGDKVAREVMDIASKRTDAELEIVDLRDFNLPFYDEVAGPSVLNGAYTHKEAFVWSDKIKEADGFIFIVAEYNHGYTAVFKNALDYLFTEWHNKPVSFVSYGNIAGGSRAVEQLRQVVVELKMHPLRDAVHIPLIWEAFGEDGKLKDPGFPTKVDNTLNQLIEFLVSKK